LILIGIEGRDAPTRARISLAMGNALRASSEFAFIHNGDANETARDREYFFANRYLLSPNVTPERFTVEGLRAAIADSIDLLASPAGMMLKTVLPRDPTGEVVGFLGQLAGQSSPRTLEGAWASADGNRAILLAQTKAPGSDIDAQQRALERVRIAFGQAVAAVATKDATAAAVKGAPAAKDSPAPNDGAATTPPAKADPAAQVTLQMSGPGVFAVASRATIQHEVLRLSLLSTAIIVALLLAIYRSPVALGLGLIPVASGALAAIAAVNLGFGEVHGLTLGFGTTLIGEAVDYSIYLFIQSDRDAGGDGAIARPWIESFWPTIRLGVLTSICGFATLMLSGFPGLAQLGLYSVTGLIAAALVTRFVLPNLLPRSFRIRDLSPLGRTLADVVRRSGALRWLAAVLAVVACAVLIVQRDALWNRELAALSPVSAEDQALDTALRADLGAPDARYLIVVPAPNAEAALAESERVAAALQPLVEGGLLAGFEAPSKILPSVATQAARQAALPPRAELEARLRAATATLPLRAERLAPFVDDVAIVRERKPLVPADLAGAGASVGAALDALLVPQRGGVSAVLPLRAPSASAIDPAPIRAALEKAAIGNALFVDVKAEADRLYAGYLHEAIVLSLAGLAAIVALLAIALRRPVRVARVVAPLLLAVVVVAAALAIANQPMTILHLVGMLLIVAVGSNYALFFDRDSLAAGDAGRPRMLASLLAANITTVAGFGLLAFSSVPVLQAIGVTVGPGAILALGFAAVLSGRQ
jgi:predicted exporter